MKSRTVTFVTANFGRGVSEKRFKNNVDRVISKAPGKHVFFSFQEIDEDDPVREHPYVREVLEETHQFVGFASSVPIAVPKTFVAKIRRISKTSNGVPRLTPHRYLVEAVVHPKDLPDCVFRICNTHFPRNIPPLKNARSQATVATRRRIVLSDTATILNLDFNSENQPHFSGKEVRLTDRSIDQILFYPDPKVKLSVMDNGVIPMTIDGHDARWAKARITWKEK